MKHWLPTAQLTSRVRFGFPVARKRPFFDQVAVFPMQPLLAPHLIEPVVIAARKRCVGTGRIAACVGSGNELHKHVLAIRQGCLIMGQKLAAVFALLLGDKGIIDHAREFLARALPSRRDGTGVLWILAPLGPTLRKSRWR